MTSANGLSGGHIDRLELDELVWVVDHSDDQRTARALRYVLTSLQHLSERQKLFSKTLKCARIKKDEGNNKFNDPYFEL